MSKNQCEEKNTITRHYAIDEALLGLLVRMVDRLPSFHGLLSDLDVIEWTENLPMALEKHDKYVRHGVTIEPQD